MVDLSQITDVKLRRTIQKLMKTVSLDPQWHDYEVLNAALHQGKKDVANYLLDHNCAVNRSTNILADTPLHNAVKLADISLVTKLIEKGASVTTVNVESNSPLHLAFLLNHTEIVDLILNNIQQTLNYDDVVNDHRLTHLHIACARGNAQVVSDFDYCGADVFGMVSRNSPVYANYNCLDFACESKSINTIEAVLRATEPFGSCIEDSLRTHSTTMKLSNFGQSLIEWQQHNLFFFEDGGVFLSRFQKACFNGCLDEVKTFLEQGKNVNEVMSKKADACPLYTPLHFAVVGGKNHQEVIELLLERGANVDLKDGFGMTPLHLAMYNSGKDFGNDDVLKILYAAVKDKEANPMDMFGLTYFHAAVALNDVEMVKKFIGRGEGNSKPILPNCRNFAKYTPLHFAVQFGHEDLVKLFVDRGANVNANEDESQFDTPLQTAIIHGQCHLVEYLLAKGANAKIVTYHTKLTIPHLLVERYNNHENEKASLVGLVKNLVKYGTNINGRDKKWYTALHNACLKIDEDAGMVRELLAWGADVNLKNRQLETPFNFTYDSVNKNTRHHFSTFYDHIQKLKELGLTIDPKNEKFCEMIMEKKKEWNLVLSSEHASWLEEIEQLKKDMLSEKVSLHDYLKMDVEQAAAFAQNERIVTLTLDEKYRSYTNYGYLIIVTHWKSQHWLAAEQQSKKQNNVEKMKVVKKPLLCPKKSKSNNATLLEPCANATLLDVGNIKDVKLADSQKSPLHLAFVSNREEIVDLMLSHMKNRSYDNLKNSLGLTHLHIVAARCNELIFRKLLVSEADLNDIFEKNSPNYPGYTALRLACDSKSLGTVKLVANALQLMNNPSADILEGMNGMLDVKINKMKNYLQIAPLPFHEACLRGSVEQVNQFLYNGQDVNEVANSESNISLSYTALHFAVESTCDRQEKIELLLEYGANVDSKDSYCMTPLHLLFYVDKKKRASIAKYNDQCVEDAALNILYKATEDKESNPTDICGLSYLHIAAAFNDCLLVKRMIFQGEDVNQVVSPNSRGFSKYTPLHFAAEAGHQSMIKLLIERGANVNANEDDLHFCTPLQAAIGACQSEAVDLLLDLGANAKVVRAQDRKTVIHLLTDEIIHNYPDSFEDSFDYGKCWLIEKMIKMIKFGADIDAKDSQGYTALYTACFYMYGHWELIEHLLMYGADINVKAENGRTALDIASGAKIRDNYNDFVELYHHVQKLKDLGLPVDPMNEKYCEFVMREKNSWIQEDENERDKIENLFSKETMENKKQERQKEIAILKEDMLTDDVSLYDYLRMAPKQAAAYAKNERIQFIIEDDEPKDLYKIYGYLIPVVYRKSLTCNESQYDA